MTREEARHILDRRTTIPGDGYSFEQINLAIDMAISALTQPSNEPLTLEELRGMYKSPIWVKCINPSKYTAPPTGWRILEKSIMENLGVWDGENCLIERTYGIDWFAYRRPPEGEEDT